MDHLRKSGFPVTVRDVRDVTAVKRQHGVPPSLDACHTAVVEGYVVEGHVPADLIDRVLRERPKIAGLAVPGMPPGSPGMETAGGAAERFQVYAFTKDGRTSVFATR